MRILVTEKAMDLPALAASLARNARGAHAALERVKALNPQIADAQRLAAGTVLILPDAPELKPGAGQAAGGEVFSDLGDRLLAGLRDLEARHGRVVEQRAADHAAVRDALKSATAKRLIEGDPQLKEQLAAAEAQFKADQKQATEMGAQMAAAAKLAEAEFEKLQNMLG
jgi:hypothetical protein